MYYLVSLFAVFIAAFSQMLLKGSSARSHSSVMYEYLNWRVILGYSIMFASLLLNIFALAKGVKVKELSIIESFSYLFVPALSWMFFGEHITSRKACSIFIIMIGAVVFFL